MRTHARHLVAALLLGGCGSDLKEGDTSGTSTGGSTTSSGATAPVTDGDGASTGSPTTTGEPTSTTTTTTTDAPTAGGDTGLKFDVGAADSSGTSGGAASEGCKRVDVIISIDNSSSMQEEIAALAGPVFDSFPAALLDVGNGLEDFQLGVIDACNNPAYLHDTGTGGPCNYSTGANYMTSTSPALLDEYHCATELTQSGYMGMPDQCSGDNDDEQPANTAADAVSQPTSADQNAGFVREDAVLFVVAITDEDEQPVPVASAQDIYDKLVAAKGNVDNVVFLGIGGGSDCDGPYGSADDASTLREVATLFTAQERGLFWDLCQGDLEAAFQAGLAVVDSACIAFEPPK